MCRQADAVEPDEKRAKLSDRGAGARHRGVAWLAPDAELQLADPLLCDLDEVQASAREVDREAAELADRVAHAVEQLRVL